MQELKKLTHGKCLEMLPETVNANLDLAFFKLFFYFPIEGGLGLEGYNSISCGPRWQGKGVRDGEDIRRDAKQGSGAPGRFPLSRCNFL